MSKDRNLWSSFIQKFEVNPLTYLNKSEPRVSPKIAESRLDVCIQCDNYLKLTHQCSKCFCFMPAKVVLSKASCPIDKWGKE